MAKLADHCLLYIEGKAFENDAMRLVAASEAGATVKVVPLAGNDEEDVLNLKVQSVANQIDRPKSNL